MATFLKFTLSSESLDKIVEIWPSDDDVGCFNKKDHGASEKISYTALVEDQFEEEFDVRLRNKNGAKFHKKIVAMYFE